MTETSILPCLLPPSREAAGYLACGGLGQPITVIVDTVRDLLIGSSAG